MSVSNEKMTNYNKIFILTFLLSLWAYFSHGQDVAFSQYSLTPLFHNPAMPFSEQYQSVALSFRRQTLPSGETYNTPIISYNGFLLNKNRQVKAGFSIGVMNDNLANFLITNGLMGAFYWKQRIAQSRHILNAGIQMGAFQRSINFDNFITDSQLINGFYNPNANNGENNNLSTPFFFSSSIGLQWQAYQPLKEGARYWAGVSFNHLNQPNISLTDVVKDQLPYNISYNAGLIAWQRREWTISPNLRGIFRQGALYHWLGSWVKYQIAPPENATIKRGSIGIGLWYNTNQALVVALQFDQPRFLLNISSDLAVGKTSNQWLGNGNVEIHLAWKFAKKVKPHLLNLDTLIVQTENPIKPAIIDTLTLMREDTIIIVKTTFQNDTLTIDTVSTNQKREEVLLATKDSLLVVDTLYSAASLIFEDIHFLYDFEDIHLTKEAIEILDEIVAIMQTNTNIRVRVVGHTCDTEGNPDTLSLRRARTAQAYLIMEGIDEKRIAIDAKSYEDPIYPNIIEDNRKQNRRVSIEVIDY
ncbi:MAG: type IX secretion system membrane protein PorP/SprF [Cytophagales bacterium]|nr:MAG: type IX secretion system membrane protein PorP/SprF [Cytophagales bacterium]